MFPILLHIKANALLPEIIIPTFMFMMMMSGLAATFYLYFRAPKMGFSQVVVLDVGMIGIACGLAGGRLFHVFFEAWYFYREDYGRILEIWRGGFVSYGAFIGGGSSIFLYLLLRKLPMLKYADFISLSLPICVFFVRVGCLGAGCCYGTPTDFFIHLVFDKLHPAAGQADYSGMAIHATQVYEMLYAVGIFIFINWYHARKKFDGQIILLFFMMYAFCRFLMEFLRGDGDRVLYWNDTISTGQIVSVLVFTFCSISYAFLNHRANQRRPAA